MVTRLDYEKRDAFPLAEVECLIIDLEHIMELSHKRKNKNKINILAEIAKEDIEMHFAELIVDLNKLDARHLNKADYNILFEDNKGLIKLLNKRKTKE